jgi:hypothetical protein
MGEYVVTPEDIKLPIPASAGGSVLHGEMSTFLIYPTYYSSGDATLRYILVECEGMALSRFGYPNDEGLVEHRLYDKGLRNVLGIAEVKNSEFLEEYEHMSARSRERIWGGRGMLSQVPNSPSGKRHFVLSFKENVFEALCDGLRLVGTFTDFSSAFDDAKERIEE